MPSSSKRCFSRASGCGGPDDVVRIHAALPAADLFDTGNPPGAGDVKMLDSTGPYGISDRLDARV